MTPPCSSCPEPLDDEKNDLFLPNITPMSCRPFLSPHEQEPKPQLRYCTLVYYYAVFKEKSMVILPYGMRCRTCTVHPIWSHFETLLNIYKIPLLNFEFSLV